MDVDKPEPSGAALSTSMEVDPKQIAREKSITNALVVCGPPDYEKIESAIGMYSCINFAELGSVAPKRELLDLIATKLLLGASALAPEKITYADFYESLKPSLEVLVAEVDAHYAKAMNKKDELDVVLQNVPAALHDAVKGTYAQGAEMKFLDELPFDQNTFSPTPPFSVANISLEDASQPGTWPTDEDGQPAATLALRRVREESDGGERTIGVAAG